ncbi:class I adenylate-forming enzyme family protein [Conexibacter sp. DBS9H8]|uniref:class I adenylate-forming enzyme family protein n=1 Tax=Conexibacter sp. DBS9H8 TaxID=2937801 RepID=UPI00200FA585|nr:AMP-binding protein [Conexibacter sp. DBS9H8]
MIDWLTRAAAARPDRVALQRGDDRLTYTQLLAEAERRRPAVEPGARVPLEDADRLAFAAALHGCLLAGAAAVPIDPRLPAADQARRRMPGPAGTPGTVVVMHTSGTTSEPKPVELTAANVFANAAGSALALGLDPAERWLAVMPLAHVGGLMILLRSAIYASTVVVHERFDPEAVLTELMDPAAAITLASFVPTMLARLLDAGLQAPPTLRWVLLGGGPIPPALLDRAAAAGVPVAPTYGMTEACSQIATFGRALHGVEIACAADGEIRVRGTVVAPGALGADGWLDTGDLGSLGADGRLRIIGRKSETIVSGGENVAPTAVEAVLVGHPDVIDVGVFGRPDPVWGEAVCARVVARGRGTPELGQALLNLCRERLATFQVPKAIEFADELPRTASGKLLRRQLM